MTMKMQYKNLKKKYFKVVHPQNFSSLSLHTKFHKILEILKQFSEINFSIAETIKNQFSKKNAKFGNKLFSLENWKRLSCKESFS